MKWALVNPPWSFDGSIYFGCRHPHLPLEYGYARALLEREGHDVLLVDAHLHDLSLAEVATRLRAFAPDRVVITTAPSYLFWRCAPPELREPIELVRAVEDVAGRIVAVLDWMVLPPYRLAGWRRPDLRVIDGARINPKRGQIPSARNSRSR